MPEADAAAPCAIADDQFTGRFPIQEALTKLRLRLLDLKSRRSADALSPLWSNSAIAETRFEIHDAAMAMARSGPSARTLRLAEEDVAELDPLGNDFSGSSSGTHS